MATALTMGMLVWSILLLLGVVHGRDSIFSDLSTKELEEVAQYLEAQTDLQLISHTHATIKDSYIFLLEAYRPYKDEALKHLDEGQDPPARAARVIIYRGDLDPPEVQEYKVSPIPKPSMHEKLIYENWRDPIPFHARSPYNGPQEALFEIFLAREFTHIEALIRHATDGYTFGSNCTEKCLRWFPAMPASAVEGFHKVTAYMVKDIEGGYLHPIGLQFVINMDSLDDKEWTISGVWFRGKHFSSFRSMGEQMQVSTEDVEVVHDPEHTGTPLMSSTLNFRGEARPTEEKRGPSTFYPDGPRYTVDGNHVEWMGWEFDFGMLTSSGLQLHDIRFLKERIVYELALQEISVFYSGGSPVASHTNYFDSVLVFGLMTSQMFPGADCPSHAEFFDFVHYANGIPTVFKNGACVFEHDRGIPLRRHYENDPKHRAGYRYAHGIPDNVLVFRHMLTVLNYDYIIDVMFHQGGQVEVKFSLTGFVLPTYYTGPDMDKYGIRMNDEHAVGNLHHHTVNFKVDMDVKGLSNRFETMDIKLEDIADDFDRTKTLKNRYLERSLKRHEMDAAYKFNFDTPKYLVVYNDKEKTKYGNHRGYRILSDAMSKMLLPESYRGYRSRAWTNYQLAVTKRKENERCSSSVYAAIEPFNPVMSFDDYIKDNESIVDEDLVLWLALGSHHIPHTEDIPIVNTPGVQLTFFLLPYNYFDEDPSLASRDNVKITPGKDNSDNFHYAGVAPPPGGEKGDPAVSCVLDQKSNMAPMTSRISVLHAIAFCVLYKLGELV